MAPRCHCTCRSSRPSGPQKTARPELAGLRPHAATICRRRRRQRSPQDTLPALPPPGGSMHPCQNSEREREAKVKFGLVARQCRIVRRRCILALPLRFARRSLTTWDPKWPKGLPNLRALTIATLSMALPLTLALDLAFAAGLRLDANWADISAAVGFARRRRGPWPAAGRLGESLRTPPPYCGHPMCRRGRQARPRGCG